MCNVCVIGVGGHGAENGGGILHPAPLVLTMKLDTLYHNLIGCCYKQAYCSFSQYLKALNVLSTLAIYCNGY